jgi:predicted peptidase
MTKRLLPAFAILAVIVLLGVALGILFGGSAGDGNEEEAIAAPAATTSSAKKTVSAKEQRPPLITHHPMAASTQFYKPYEFKTLSERILTYFWLEPAKPHPRGVKFPLVILLHGGSGRAYAGEYLATSLMRERYPSFIAVPVTPKPPIWAHPDAKYSAQENLGYVEELIGDLLQTHPVDPNRIYIIGCSIGGTGVFGAIARYPDLFAAGVAISGYWKTIDAPIMINTPLLIIHGAEDSVIDATVSRDMANAVKDSGGHRVLYREVERFGHNCPSSKLYNINIWHWLYAQNKMK